MRRGLPPLALLAGGLATRMLPLTEGVPKSLLTIDGEPFLAHQLRLLVGQGVERIVICSGHLGEQIERFAGDGSLFGCHIQYSYDGDTLLGTGGALRRALPFLSENFFVMYGDSYLFADPARAWDAFLTAEQPALMTIVKSDGHWDASNAEMRDGKIVRYDKRTQTTALPYIDYGLSLMRASVLDAWPDRKPFDLADVMSALAADGKLAAYEVRGRFYEIGSPEGFRATEQMLMALRRSRESKVLSMAWCER